MPAAFLAKNLKGKAMICANVTRAAVLVSTIALAGVFGFSPSAAQDAPADVAHVAAVSSRVVALIRGTPSLLDTADVISDRTRLDVLADSELQVCHHRLQRFVKINGPARVTISAGGMTVESGQAVIISKETCAPPQTSKSLSDAWADTTSAHGRLMLTVLGGLAEFERELIRARTDDGRTRAKARGVRFGRPKSLTPHQRQEVLQRLAVQADLARTYGVSQATISRLAAPTPFAESVAVAQ
jgi:Resolvase, N terminal domain